MSEEEQTFTTIQVCSILDVSYRQLDYWDRSNLLPSSHAHSKGSGSKRKYTYDGLIRANIVKQLRAIDLGRDHILHVLESYDNNDAIFSLAFNNFISFNVNFEEIVNDVHKRVDNLNDI